jgi:hypothetical protein
VTPAPALVLWVSGLDMFLLLDAHDRLQAAVQGMSIVVCVTEQLLDGLERHTPHDQVAGERVPQDVPADQTEPCALAGPPEGVLGLPLG